MVLTTIDMSLFFGTPEQQQEFSQQLLHTLKTRGVAKIKNHSIPEAEISKLFEMTREFFALSHDEKMYAKHPPQSTPNRGYSYVGQESISSISGYDKGISTGKSVRDVKETYDLGAADDTSAPNQWIRDSSLPGFRPFMEHFYATAFTLETQLLAALATALSIPAPTLLSMHAKAQNEFRLLHYPAIHAQELRDGSATRIAEHTDFGTLTMLFQDSTGGLQVEDQEHLGTFHDVSSASQNEIILNIGDSLQRLTNDTFRAACHRVTYPPTITADHEEIIPERFSVAYFAKVDRDTILYPFQEFITEERPAKYPGMTSGEFNNLRIAKLFAKVEA